MWPQSSYFPHLPPDTWYSVIRGKPDINISKGVLNGPLLPAQTLSVVLQHLVTEVQNAFLSIPGPLGSSPTSPLLLIFPCTLHLNSNRKAWMCAQSFYFHVFGFAVCSSSWQNGFLPILPGPACTLPPPWGLGTNDCPLHGLYRWHMLQWQQLSHPASHHGHLCQHGICPHSLSILGACADLLGHLVAKHYVGQELNWMEMCNILYAMNFSSQELTLVWRSQNKSWSWRVSKNIMAVSGTQ